MIPKADRRQPHPEEGQGGWRCFSRDVHPNNMSALVRPSFDQSPVMLSEGARQTPAHGCACRGVPVSVRVRVSVSALPPFASDIRNMCQVHVRVRRSLCTCLCSAGTTSESKSDRGNIAPAGRAVHGFLPVRHPQQTSEVGRDGTRNFAAHTYFCWHPNTTPTLR